MSPAASAARFRRAWLMIVSMPIVVLPVERSPMISSRWPRPIGIIASIAMMPVCTGWLTGFAADDAGRDLFDRIETSLLIGPLPSTGWPSALTTRPSSPLPTGTCSSLPVVRTSRLRGAGVVAQNDRPDFGLFQVQRQADDAVAEIEHLVQHRIGEAFDLGHAVADFANVSGSRAWPPNMYDIFPAWL